MDLPSSDRNEKKTDLPLKKKFITGYKHKLTGKMFHHAIIQTPPPPWKYELVLKFHRDSQTVEMCDKAHQTPKNASSQVQARNTFISSNSDKTVECNKNFQYADDIEKELVSKIIILQKYTRRWLAQQEVIRIKNASLLQNTWDQEELNLKAKQDIYWSKELNKRRLYPRTEEDFRILFSDLQKWWDTEAKKIDNAKKNEAMLLLTSEVKKIVTINNQKNLSKQMQELRSKERLLEMAAYPKMWKTYDSEIQVENYDTQKGRYLHELYKALSMKYLSSQDRINILTSLKEIVLPYHSKLTDNLLHLANREIDLIIRGTRNDRLDGLRNRIRNLFWQFAKQPVNNPQMSTFKEINVQHTFCCTSCNRFYSLESDAISEDISKSNLTNYPAKCEKCLYIKNEAWIRKDLEFYKKLLKMLICEEEKKVNISGIIYALRPNDIKYIVEKIWKRQSCISGLAKEDNLELTRYDFEEKWTPWNCLLVTKEEAQNLQKTPYLKSKYEQKFKECVAQRHAEAKTYFSTIPRFLPYISIVPDSLNEFLQ